MAPNHELPLPKGYSQVDKYVDDLLSFVTSSELLNLLCGGGGVHILDFFVSTPDLFEQIFDRDWIDWFNLHAFEDLLDFLLHEDVGRLKDGGVSSWRGKPLPPKTLVDYVSSIQKLCLDRAFTPSPKQGKILPRIAMGMREKKLHEVGNFSVYVNDLVEEINKTRQKQVSHLVDFGAGQSYLPRVLASRPYGRHVVALEGKAENVKGAKALDITARLAPKEKKSYHQNQTQQGTTSVSTALGENEISGSQSPTTSTTETIPIQSEQASSSVSNNCVGTIQHIQQQLEDGDLTSVFSSLAPQSPNTEYDLAHVRVSERKDGENYGHVNADSHDHAPGLFVMSLHSCGNLSHHALKSLILNRSVCGVAVVGCCYNLLTEKLTPPSYKMPSLRPNKDSTTNSEAGDPHGFPMSRRLSECPTLAGKGVRFNITGRMMAVQAPGNWGTVNDMDFFRRHFYRSLLQRIFVDRGVADLPVSIHEEQENEKARANGQVPKQAKMMSSQPIIIGSLRKKCYKDFVSYVRGAISKLLNWDSEWAPLIQSKMDDLKDEEIQKYEEAYEPRHKHLNLLWSLMAISAQLLEAVIIVDRWLWLKEQDEVKKCWVEPVFDYKLSPRNLAVFGVKK